MHPTLRACSRAHTPLIQFIGKRVWPSTTEAPHAHPAGVPLPPGFGQSAPSPSESSSAQSSTGKSVYNEFWEAPQRFQAREISADEITAIETGGASQW